MLRCLICCALLAMPLTGCGKRENQVVFATPHVPAELRQPCPAPKFAGIATDGAFSDAIVRQAAALRCANGKIVTIDKILSDAERFNGDHH